MAIGEVVGDGRRGRVGEGDGFVGVGEANVGRIFVLRGKEGSVCQD